MWTYSGDPSASALDEVRFLVGDTDDTDELLQDAEVTYAITKYGGVQQSAVALCLALASRFARLVDIADDLVKAAYSQRAKAFQALAETLNRQLVAPLAAPWAGNFDQAYQQQVATDLSLIQPRFTVGMTDDPGLEPGPLRDALLATEVP